MKIGMFIKRTIKLMGRSNSVSVLIMLFNMIEAPVAPPVIILFGFENHSIPIENVNVPKKIVKMFLILILVLFII